MADKFERKYFASLTFGNNDVRLAQIGYSFIVMFEDYLRTCPPLRKSQSLNNNGIMKHLERLQKMTTLTLHVARHTFATTIALLNDVPIETVSKMLGHTKLSTTQKYARVIEKKISKDMMQLKAKLKSSKKSLEYTETAFDHLKIV